jgi:glycosyltransferase involved in cell wall biosynthesis
MKMSRQAPRVSIGLPVFNGEVYLCQALDSLLAQTFTDFEIIISDNGSTDRTKEICQAYSARDPRIRYLRQEINVGAAKNFNRVFELAVGEYFKWAAHDDLVAPEFLERCMRVLDQDHSIVLCYPKTWIIDEHGNRTMRYVVELNATSWKPHERLRNLLSTEHWSFQIFGVFRATALKMTSLIGNYTDSDMVLLAEICLIGRECEIPEHLFFRREHPKTSISLFPGRQERMEWFDPDNAGKRRFPSWLKFRGYFASIKRTPMSQYERLLCYVQLGRWLIEKTFLRLARRLNLRLDTSHIAIPVDKVGWE